MLPRLTFLSSIKLVQNAPRKWKCYLLGILTAGLANLGSPGNVHARPVSYPGGTTLLLANDADSHNFAALYTAWPHWAIGYSGSYFPEKEWSLQTIEFDWLCLRWNGAEGQASAYLKGALGTACSRTFSRCKPGWQTGISLDWESRRYFVLYQNQLTYGQGFQTAYRQKGRLGIAPYIGQYGDLHTWLMLQVEHAPSGARHKLTLTPLVRFFKGQYLWELGVSLHGGVLLNGVIRF